MATKTSGVITEQLDLLELNLRVARLMLMERQSQAVYRECRFGIPFGCLLCRIKRGLLRKRYV